MREASLVTRLLYGVIVASVLITGVLATIALRPQATEAAGIMADLMCLSAWDYSCPCGPPCRRGGPPGGMGCPCFDITSGFKTPGLCVGPTRCLAQNQPGMPQMPMMPMPPPPSPSQGGPCGTGTESVWRDINGVIASTTNASSTGAASSTPGCDPNAFNNFSTPTFPTFDTSIFDMSGGAGGAPDFSSGISGTENSVVSSLLDGTINLGGSSNTSGSIVPGGSTASSTPRPPFGSANGVSGDVRLQGTAVTLMVSNREVARGTQVSGMYGYSIVPGITALTVFKTMCGLRPWNTSYLSYIIPSAYFDSLCTARGFALGARITGSTASTAAKPASAAPASQVAPPPPPPTPPAYLGSMSAEIWAVPPTVSNGNRTSVFWNAKGALTCSVTSSDGNFSGSSLSGHASTQPLNKNTTFTIYCQSATSSVSNQVVVPVQ